MNICEMLSHFSASFPLGHLVAFRDNFYKCINMLIFCLSEKWKSQVIPSGYSYVILASTVSHSTHVNDTYKQAIFIECCHYA